MSEHDCQQETPIELLKQADCTMQKDIERMREHIDGSPARHQELKDAINGLKVWVLSGVAASLFAVLLQKLVK